MRHEFDPMAMIAGLAFAAIAVLYLLDSAGVLDVHAGVTLGLAAAGLGLAGVAGALRAAIPPKRRDPEGKPPADD